MVVIQRGKGESKESIFRKFSKTFFEENIVNDLRKRLFYKKPSLVRKEEEKERATAKKKMPKFYIKSEKK